MREILFRGKRVYNGEWVEGYAFDDDLIESNKMFIGYIVIENGMATGQNFYEVIPETVGQYTGLTDKNGKKIFEGDIILYGFIPCVVKYDIENARFMLYEKGVYLRNGFNIDTMKLKEVIGNIHDNPELLGGAEQ